MRRKRTLESGAGAALLPFYFYFFIETISLVTAPSREFSSSSVVILGLLATYRIRDTDLFYLLTPSPSPTPGLNQHHRARGCSPDPPRPRPAPGPGLRVSGRAASEESECQTVAGQQEQEKEEVVTVDSELCNLGSDASLSHQPGAGQT